MTELFVLVESLVTIHSYKTINNIGKMNMKYIT